MNTTIKKIALYFHSKDSDPSRNAAAFETSRFMFYSMWTTPIIYEPSKNQKKPLYVLFHNDAGYLWAF